MKREFELRILAKDFRTMWVELDEITSEASENDAERVWLDVETLKRWTTLALVAYGLVSECMAGGRNE